MTTIQRTRKVLPCLALLLFTAACDTEQPAAVAEAMDSLVSVEWLNAELGSPDLVVLDCSVRIERTDDGGYRGVSGRPEYETGHIPGAVYADLVNDLSDTDSPLQFAVPSPETFAAAMAALGVGNDTRVVLYDSSGSSWAARVWWMLRWIGFDRAALLDGGLAAWQDAGLPLSTEVPRQEARTLSVNLRPELIVDRDTVRAAIGDDDVRIIDALAPEQFRGERTTYGRPGHIPGAENIPARSLKDEQGRYLPASELATLLEGDRDARTINYCGGGISASSNAFALTRLGYRNVSVYTASLQEWAADPEYPLETD